MPSPNEIIAKFHSAIGSGEVAASLFEELFSTRSGGEECEVIDFKQQVPLADSEYAKTVRDLIALHNSYGGFIVFGVKEVQKDKEFEVSGVAHGDLQVSKLKDFVRNYTGCDIRIRHIELQINGKQLDVVWVVKRAGGEVPVKFAKNGPDIKPRTPAFKKGEVVFRRIDSNAIAQQSDDYEFLFSERRPPSLDVERFSERQMPLDNNLPDRAVVCSKFVGRSGDIGDLWVWLADDFSRVRLIAGEGGLGKTSLAYRFAEEISARSVKSFNRVVWLTAKKRQFIPSEGAYREAGKTDFSSADTLFRAISESLGCIDSDFDGLDSKGVMQLALESCENYPSFIVVDDVDSLDPEDQRRVLEFGMRTPAGTKMLLTTRVNFSYSPDNVLKLDGLPKDDFIDFINVLRARYGLCSIKESKVDHLREVTGGSPLFADSLLRLERRGLHLDQAIAQWKGEKGMDARKAALEREVVQLSREAKRVLYVISLLKNCSFIELSQVFEYTQQTLGDAIQELSSLFLISAPPIAEETRFSVEPNTGLLVLELAPTLGIDHAALSTKTRRRQEDAISQGFRKRSNIVGLAIAQSMALLKEHDVKGALSVVQAASKKLSRAHPDLLLASGRFRLCMDPPDFDEAAKSFESAYKLGQRKPLLFTLWFEAEFGRGKYESALEVATIAMENNGSDQSEWYEARAKVHVTLAKRSQSSISADAAVRELDFAISDLRAAMRIASAEAQRRRMSKLIAQAEAFRERLVGS